MLDVIYNSTDPVRNSSHRQTEYRYGGSLLAVEGKTRHQLSSWNSVGKWLGFYSGLQAHEVHRKNAIAAAIFAAAILALHHLAFLNSKSNPLYQEAIA